MGKPRLNLLPVRFLTKVAVDDDTGCWIWRAGVSGNGYAYFWWRDRMVRAHTFAYECTVGLIPEHLDPDHLCRNRICVNPSHMELVTQAENNRRAAAANRSDVCRKCGDSQWYFRPGSGRRDCATCKRVRRAKAAGIPVYVSHG